MSKFIDDIVASMNSATTAHRAETERDRLAHHAVVDDLFQSIRSNFGSDVGPTKIMEVIILILSSIARASVSGPRARFHAALAISTMVLDQIMQEPEHKSNG